jgi:NarL family two-component system response regulator LiaR
VSDGSAAAVTVVVVDDHDLLREGVVSALASYDDLRVVGEAPSGELAIQVVADLEPDVVIIDLVMPGMGGVEAVRRLRAGHPELGIVALSSFSESSRVHAAIEAGATSYLVKSIDADSLARAVRGAAAGHGTFSPEAMRAMTDRPADGGTLGQLTMREREIADLVAEGRSNADIAAALSLSVYTVKNHVSNILMKLAVQSRTEAAAVIHRASER